MTGGGECAAEQGDRGCQAGAGGCCPSPPSKGCLQKETPAKLAGMLTDWGQNQNSVPTAALDRGHPVLQCRGLCPAAHFRALRAAPSLSGSGTFPTPHLHGAIKHGAYFHLQGLHCCEQVFKSVPHFWSKAGWQF